MTSGEFAGQGGVVFRPIGVIRTPFQQSAGTPIQPRFAEGAEGRVELDDAWVEGLADLDGFDRIWLIYWFDRVGPVRLTVRPFLDARDHGLFCTRAPCRPNAIGFSPVRLLGVEGNVLRVADVDMLDRTPLLDVKPYSPRFDCFPDSRSGWLDDAPPQAGKADERFD